MLHSVWLLQAICILCMHSLDIGTMHKQYTHWVRSTAIVAICNMQYAIWLLPSFHTLQVGLDTINLLLGHCLAVFLFSDVIIMSKLLKNLLAHTKQIWHKIAQWPKRRLIALRPTWRMWRDGSNHIAYYRKSYTAHSICICLHNMYIAGALFLYLNCKYTICILLQ